MFNKGSNDREIAIVGGAFLDTLLEHILVNFFVADESEVEKLLSPNNSIGTYGSRTSTIYCLGLVGTTIRDDLKIVGKIRNKFAHNLKASFDEDPVKSWCMALKWHKFSMSMKPPENATARDCFQVGVNQLICHLSGVVSIARTEKRKTRPNF